MMSGRQRLPYTPHLGGKTRVLGDKLLPTARVRPPAWSATHGATAAPGCEASEVVALWRA